MIQWSNLQKGRNNKAYSSKLKFTKQHVPDLQMSSSAILVSNWQVDQFAVAHLVKENALRVATNRNEQ